MLKRGLERILQERAKKMLVAENREGNRIKAGNAERYCEKGAYFCPKCGEPVHTKKGRIRMDHFAHYPEERTECEFWEPETETHLLMKKEARKLFESSSATARLEVQVGESIPDLLVTFDNGDRMAVECQHSKITEEKIAERTERLKEHVEHVVWVFSADRFDRGFDELYFKKDEGIFLKQAKRNPHQLGGTIHSSTYDIRGFPYGYISLSEKVREELDIPLEDSFFFFPEDHDHYRTVMESYHEKKKEKRRGWLQSARARMRGDEIDELFDIDRTNSLIKRRREAVLSGWDERPIKWLFGKLKKRDKFLSNLTEEQERGLALEVAMAKKLGFRRPQKKWKSSKLYYKSLGMGNGAIFLDFRNVPEAGLKPDFYPGDDASPSHVAEELEANFSDYDALTKFDLEKKIKALKSKSRSSKPRKAGLSKSKKSFLKKRREELGGSTRSGKESQGSPLNRDKLKLCDCCGRLVSEKGLRNGLCRRCYARKGE